MKRFLAFLLAMVISLPLSLSAAVCSFAATESTQSETQTKIVYVSDSGNDSNSGASADKPFKLLSKAYTALGDEGGIIRIVGTLTNENNNKLTSGNGFVEPKHSGKIIIEGANSSSKFFMPNNASTGFKSRFFTSGETEFRNITISINNGGRIGACHNKLTFGEGVVMEGSGSLYVYGGCNEAYNLHSVADHSTWDTHLVFYSGSYHAIVGDGGNSASTTATCVSNSATHTIEILGDIKTNIIIPGNNSVNAQSVTANLVIDGNISKNFNDLKVYFGGWSAYSIKTLNVLLLGGKIIDLGTDCTRYVSGGKINIYTDTSNADAVALANTIKSGATSSVTVTENAYSRYCADIFNGHAYGTDGVCDVCKITSGCSHNNTVDVIDQAPTCAVAGICHVSCLDCGVTVEENVIIPVDDTAHKEPLINKTTSGYAIVCPECDKIVDDTYFSSPTVYVSADGAGEYGQSVLYAISSLERAYYLLSECGGEIVICGKYLVTPNYHNALVNIPAFEEPEHKAPIKVTGLDTGTPGCLYFESSAPHWYMSGDVTFENINFEGRLGVILAARHHDLTMGDGLAMTFPSGAGLWLLGCCQQGGENVCDNYDTHITIKSGTYFNIIGGMRATNTNVVRKEEHYSGDHYIEVLGDISLGGYFTPANTNDPAGDAFLLIDGNITTTGYFYFAGVTAPGGTVNNVTLVLKSGSINPIAGSYPGGITRVTGEISAYYSNQTDAASLIQINKKYIKGFASDWCIEQSNGHIFEHAVCKYCATVESSDVDTLYVSGDGTGDGYTINSPTNSIKKGFNLAFSKDMTIVLVGDITLDSLVSMCQRSKNVTITSVDVDGDGVYPKLILRNATTFENAGTENTITFENIELCINTPGRIFWYLNYNNLTIGEGVSVSFSESFADSDNYPVIYAGYSDAYGLVSAEQTSNDYDVTINISSGTWGAVMGGNRRTAEGTAIGNNRGDITINILGGSLLGNDDGAAISGSGNNFVSGDITVNVMGGNIRGDIYGVYKTQRYVAKTPFGEYGYKGDITFNFTGGTIDGVSVYAQFRNTEVSALVRGDVVANVSSNVKIANGLFFDFKGTQGYAGTATKSSVVYDASHASAITYKFVDEINGTATNAGEPVRIAFIGDSITQGVRVADYETLSYPAQFGAMLDPDEYIVGNFGVGGSRVTPYNSMYFYNNTLHYFLSVEEFDPNYVSFNLGTNDAGIVGVSVGPTQYFEDLYVELISDYADLDTVEKIIVATPIWRNDGSAIRNATFVEPTMRTVAKRVAELYSDIDVDLFELGAVTLYDSLENKILSADNLHPHAEGYKIMAEAFYAAFFEDALGAPEGFYLEEVYIADSGRLEGDMSKSDPTTNIAAAMYRAAKTGASIILAGNYTWDSTLLTPLDITGTLKIYALEDFYVFTWNNSSFKLGCDTEIDNLVFKTTTNDPLLLCLYNDLTLGEMFYNVSEGTYDLTIGAGSWIHGDLSVTDTSSDSTYDHYNSASSSNDVHIVIKNGTIGGLNLGNRRMETTSTYGNYSGNMVVDLLGGRFTGNGILGNYNGALGGNNLSGTITVNIDGMLFEKSFYVVLGDSVATASPIVNDKTLNTGKITINVTEDMREYIEINRLSENDALYVGFDNYEINIIVPTVLGDVDRDGLLTNSDIALLVRYLSGWDVKISLDMADVYADGKINNRDAVSAIYLLLHPVEKATRVICVGDSITYGIGATTIARDSYPSQLANMLGAKYYVKNYGVSSSTMIDNREYTDYVYTAERSKAYKSTDEYKNSLRSNPDIVIIGLGANDAYHSNLNTAINQEQYFLDSAIALANEYLSLESAPTVIFLVPSDRFDAQYRRDYIKNVISPAIYEAAETVGAQVIDLNTLFEEYANTKNTSYIYTDGVHLTTLGYQVVANAIYQHIIGDVES